MGSLRRIVARYRHDCRVFDGLSKTAETREDSNMIPFRYVVAVLILLAPLLALATLQSPSDFEHGVIRYASTKPTDPVARLQEQLDSGKVKLAFDPRWGYLPAVLDHLKIPRSSQSLVFSKTSLQLLLISPKSPRALYFNDDVYIGGVLGSELMEIASVDPNLGTIFYTLSQKKGEAPRFEREYFACLLCHDSAATQGVPGLTMLSVLPDPDGRAMPGMPTVPMTDRTPFKERFGGWYVTGSHGEQRHWGNMTTPNRMDMVRDHQAFIRRLDFSPGANATSLRKHFDTTQYLTADSDIVAVMVMGHQTRIHNWITKANYDVRNILHEDESFAKLLGKSDSQHSEITQSRVKSAVEPLVRAMLFVWEAELASPVSGNTSFAADFMKRGPRDRNGRSLRDFDLTKRLFRYPLSYLIYSEPFDALPDAAKVQFYSRLRDVLTGADENKDFAHLSLTDRQAILEILNDTKPDFVNRKP
jgi:hypothetical protein